ncbi:odorant receptor 278 [Tribolium castaneum]|uniref:Odorant receptor n=1 Tax=Tribolium castaneum TaxID=7070 RepID=D2A344_TRICA|nr:odorant receptor 278 [Tribolium castaneum]
MNQPQESFLKNDYLKVLKLISSDVFEPRLVRAILFVVFAVQLTASIITVRALLIKELTAKEFVLYGPVFFGCFYGMLAIYIIIFQSSFITNMSQELEMWSYSSGGEEINRRVKFQSRVITIYALVNFLLAIVASYLYFSPLDSDNETFYMVRFIEEKIPDYAKICKIAYRTTFLAMGYVMIVHSYQVIYASQHVRFQIIFFTEYVKKVVEFDEKISEECLFYNERFQTIVGKRLQNCVIRHIQFLKFDRIKIKEMSNLIAAFSLCGCLLGISISFYVLSGIFYREHFLRVALISVTAVSTFFALILAGQSMESKANSAHIIMNNIKWYNFNQSNKKAYLLLLMMSMKQYKIKFSENYSINYELGLTIVRGIYSIISVMANMHFDN